MIEILLMDGMRPFVIAGGLVIAFLLLEVVLAMVGLSSDILSDADADISADLDADLDADVDGGGSGVFGDVMGFIGLRKLPLTVWLSLFSALFASVGLATQSTLLSITGAMLPTALVAWPAAIASGVLTGRFASTIARIIPRDETTAVSELSLGRRMGVVTVGTARRGQAANVRITDQHGNTHYLMLEPLEDEEEIPEGADVYVLRTRNDGLRITAA